MKNEKYTEEEIDRTIEFFHILGIKISFFSLLLTFGIYGFEIATNEGSMPSKPGLVYWYGIRAVLFIFVIVILLILTPGNILVYHNKKIDKIDEEEKARQQALLLETEERNRANSQIWVI